MLERNNRVLLKPVIFGFIVWRRQDSGHVCTVTKVLSLRVKMKVFIARAVVLMKIPFVLVTLTFIFFCPSQVCKSRRKDQHIGIVLPWKNIGSKPTLSRSL